jgi:tetratricopeptide (TPR) repeat protein
LGDKKGIARSLIYLGWAAIFQGEGERATGSFGEGLTAARESGDEWGITFALNGLAALATFDDEEGLERAEALWEEALEWGRRLGDVLQISMVLLNTGNGKLALGDYRGAEVQLEASLALSRELKDTQGEAMGLVALGIAAARLGDLGRAKALLEESLPLHRQLGGIRDVAENLEALAEVAGERGEVRRGAQLWGAADALRQTTGAPWVGYELRVHEPYLAAARSRMDEAAWSEAWEEGRAMTLEEAVSYAVKEDAAG